MKKLLLLLSVCAFMSCKNENQNVNTDTTTENNAQVESSFTEGDFDGEEMLAFNPEKTDLKWTAYKTPEKVAVHGSFDNIDVKDTKESNIPEEILEGASFDITTSSMTTGDVSRDAKILSLFFNNMDGANIIGSFGEFNNGVVPVKIVMNGVKVEKNFQYTFENKKIIITGVIDVIEDFKANRGFDLLHEACAELHLNKTWTDVSIEIISDLEKPKA
ncbi:YceI family protein [Weeksellaceae bacterium KMM 9713]|uniref:YceI family protein n=1 Tax=Profundicola chukchiensis TaxID=2961959 RepID=A0A9X4N0P3_9FLAO|nr:YceI family protein [Profundicola chukchiensis]MDG4946595.1 YceI family protein [Profundicola chukchiensis]